MRRIKFIHAGWALCLLAAGCQGGGSKSAPSPLDAASASTESPHPAATPKPSLEAPPIPGNQEGLAAATDPCALQLGDLIVALQLYYTWNKQLPANLEDLQPYAEKGTTLKFECPVTHQLYVYVPRGLHGSSIHDDLLVYDQSAAHRGERWGIVMSPPVKGSPLVMYVIPVNDTLLKAYGGSK